MAILGDCHAPWVEQRVIDKFVSYCESTKPDVIIQVGDLYDLFAQSKYARTHSLCTPTEEIKMARKWATIFWHDIRKVSPKSHLYQLIGNHDERAKKRMLEKCPELEPFFDFKSPYRFDGVVTQESQRDVLVLDGTVIQHGHYSRLGQHCQYNLAPTIVGHTHKGGVFYMPLKDRMIFELNVGFAASIEAVPMRYSASTITKWTHGFGVVDEHGPRFIPC